MRCPTCDDDCWAYRPAAPNEDGWSCANCGHQPGEPAGFCPQLDRSDTAGKVHDLLDVLHDRRLVYVSNGTQGAGMVAAVAGFCQKVGYYDQYTIIQALVKAAGHPSHADYWKKVAEGVMGGNDPRDRCECGALATIYRTGKDGSRHFCREHGMNFILE